MGMKRGARLGKYRVMRKIGVGGFATVYEALDTIEGVRVALKIAHPHLVDSALLEDFRREVRITAKLDHPNILNVKNATFIDEQFVIATRLGEQTLGDRMAKRIATDTAIHFWSQMVEALAYAHRNRVIHCDIKPDNFIVFPGNHLRLSDFGVAFVARHTMSASSGTVGFMAPEQALGRTSFRSDVFSLGLVAYKLFSGALPEYPFDWPPPGIERVRGKLRPELIAILERSLAMKPRDRYETVEHVRRAFDRAKTKGIRPRRRAKRSAPAPDWKEVRWRAFRREFGATLRARDACEKCDGPVNESMSHCPWCRHLRRAIPKALASERHCPRCRRSVKSDWRYCAHCYGGRLPETSSRPSRDARYQKACANRGCERKELLPFSRYCVWCRTKVARPWPLDGTRERCPSCRWGVAGAYWDYCGWCGHDLARARESARGKARK